MLLPAGLVKNRGAPLNSIWELGANPEPFTVNVNVVESAAMFAGLREAIAGTGKLTYSWHEPKSSIIPISATVESFEPRLNVIFFPPGVCSDVTRNSNPKEY